MSCRSRLILLGVLACSPASSLLAQEPADTAAAGSPAPEAATTGGAADSASDARRFIPFPVLFYAPETGLGFGAAAVWYFRAERSRLSSLSPLLVYTSRGQFLVSARLESWFGRNRWRAVADAGFSRFPTKFWGIGNETPDEAEEDYTPRTVRGLAGLERRVAGSLYAGITASALARDLVEVEEDGALSAGSVPGTGRTELWSLGLSATWDSRDDVVTPRRGVLGLALVERVTDRAREHARWTAWSVDVRGYVPIGQFVVAGQAVFRDIGGTAAPFDRLPGLGGDRLLRGYYEGRWRDATLLLFQAEARVPVWRRFGAVAFVGAGQVAPGLSSMGLDRLHGSAGIGVRYRLARDRPLNVRADFAVGEGSTGLYVQVGEAF